MAISVRELREWAKSLPDDADVAVDDGGLVLVEVAGEAWLEVGGEPEQQESER